MDWDWEDGPPTDASRRPDEPPPSPAPGPPSFSDAVERFEVRPDQIDGRDRDDEPQRPDSDDVRPSYFDDDRTQIIRSPRRPVEEASAGRPPDQRPRDDSALEERLRTERRSRTPADRAAARARRRRQVRRRQLTALAVIAVIIVVLVVLIVRGCGGPAEGVASSPTNAALRTPAAAEPLRMAAYGESVGGGALLGIRHLTEQRKDIKVRRFVKVSSGLTRPDYFDWPAYLKQDMARRKKPYEAVAIMLGANDGQDAVVDGEKLAFGSDAWKAMYARRVAAVMDFYLEHGVKRVYWAGMPRMGTEESSRRMEALNAIYEAEAAKRAPRVEYIDVWKAVDAPGTAYRAGSRQADGVHLSVGGGTKAAEAIMTAVAADWHLPAFGEGQ